MRLRWRWGLTCVAGHSPRHTDIQPGQKKPHTAEQCGADGWGHSVETSRSEPSPAWWLSARTADYTRGSAIAQDFRPSNPGSSTAVEARTDSSIRSWAHTEGITNQGRLILAQRRHQPRGAKAQGRPGTQPSATATRQGPAPATAPGLLCPRHLPRAMPRRHGRLTVRQHSVKRVGPPRAYAAPSALRERPVWLGYCRSPASTATATPSASTTAATANFARASAMSLASGRQLQQARDCRPPRPWTRGALPRICDPRQSPSRSVPFSMPCTELSFSHSTVASNSIW